MPRSHPTSRNDNPSRRAAIATRQRFFELDRAHVSVRLGSSRADMMYWGVLGDRWWRNYLHAHSFYEVCYAFAGKGTFRILGNDCPVKDGDVFVAKPDETHEIVSSRSSPLGIYFWAFNLVRQQDHQPSEVDRPIDQLLEALAAAKQHVTRADPAIGRTLELMNREVATKRYGYGEAIRGLTAKLLVDSARAVTGSVEIEQIDTPSPDAAQAAVRTAVRYLRDNLARPIEVRDVAAQVHLSERHLTRLFRRETGTSILEYLTALRIELASQLILDKSLSIKQVARAVGYPDPHYFTTLFGRRT